MGLLTNVVLFVFMTSTFLFIGLGDDFNTEDTILESVFAEGTLNTTPTLNESFKDSIPVDFASTTVNNPDSTFTFVDPIRAGLTSINQFTNAVVNFPERLNDLNLPSQLIMLLSVVGILTVLGIAFYFRGSSGGS